MHTVFPDHQLYSKVVRVPHYHINFQLELSEELTMVTGRGISALARKLGFMINILSNMKTLFLVL